MQLYKLFYKKYRINPDGCCSNSCYIKKPKRQATNGPCVCFNHLDKEARLAARREIWNIKEVNHE